MGLQGYQINEAGQVTAPSGYALPNPFFLDVVQETSNGKSNEWSIQVVTCEQQNGAPLTENQSDVADTILSFSYDPATDSKDWGVLLTQHFEPLLTQWFGGNWVKL